MTISDLIAPAAVMVDVKAVSKARLLEWLAGQAGALAGVSTEVALAALQRREALGSTGIGGGIAMPHAPVPGLARPFGLLARLAKPLAFDAVDGEPVDIVCLVLTPPAAQGEHLNALACVARSLRQPEVLSAIRRAKQPQEVHAVLCGA